MHTQLSRISLMASFLTDVIANYVIGLNDSRIEFRNRPTRWQYVDDGCQYRYGVPGDSYIIRFRGSRISLYGNRGGEGITKDIPLTISIDSGPTIVHSTRGTVTTCHHQYFESERLYYGDHTIDVHYNGDFDYPFSQAEVEEETSFTSPAVSFTSTTTITTTTNPTVTEIVEITGSLPPSTNNPSANSNSVTAKSTSSPSANSDSANSTSNKSGIIAGSVLGSVALLLVVAGVWWKIGRERSEPNVEPVLDGNPGGGGGYYGGDPGGGGGYNRNPAGGAGMRQYEA